MNSVLVCSDTLTDCSGPNSPSHLNHLVSEEGGKSERERERERGQNKTAIIYCRVYRQTNSHGGKGQQKKGKKAAENRSDKRATQTESLSKRRRRRT